VFPNLTALAFDIINTRPIGDVYTFISLHHAHIRKLSITDSIIPHLCASLQQGALSLPSLTHFILLDIYRLVHTGELVPLQSLFVKVTHFDIRKGGGWKCGFDVRQILDLMPFLQQFSVFGTAVQCGLDALLMAPIKQVDKLVIFDSETDGSDVNAYYDALDFESADCLGISIQFVNYPYISKNGFLVSNLFGLFPLLVPGIRLDTVCGVIFVYLLAYALPCKTNEYMNLLIVQPHSL